MTYFNAIIAARPGCEFSIENNNPDKLVWLDDTPAPTSEELDQYLADWNDAAGNRSAAINAENGPTDRDDIIDGFIVVGGQAWQVNAKSRENITNTIAYATRNDMLDQTETWILADNTERPDTTIADLIAVMDAYTMRMRETYAQYKVWRAGDMLVKFEVTE